MKTNKIAKNSFGLKFTDNISLESLKYIWSRNFPNSRNNEVFYKIKTAANDTFTLTIDKIYENNPEFILRKMQYPNEKLQVKFYNIKEVILKKRGRPPKNPKPITRKEPLNPTNIMKDILNGIKEYKRKYKLQ